MAPVSWNERPGMPRDTSRPAKLTTPAIIAASRLAQFFAESEASERPVVFYCDCAEADCMPFGLADVLRFADDFDSFSAASWVCWN